MAHQLMFCSIICSSLSSMRTPLQSPAAKSVTLQGRAWHSKSDNYRGHCWGRVQIKNVLWEICQHRMHRNWALAALPLTFLRGIRGSADSIDSIQKRVVPISCGCGIQLQGFPDSASPCNRAQVSMGASQCRQTINNHVRHGAWVECCRQLGGFYTFILQAYRVWVARS